MNKKIYIITIIISTCLIIPSCISCMESYKIVSLFSGIGCSGIAAAVMAIFLESAALKREQAQKQKSKNRYFYGIYAQMKMLLERLLWFEEKLQVRDFNWDLDPREYSTLNYMAFAAQGGGGENLSFQEFEKRINVLCEKYNLENIKNFSDNDVEKITKMFRILYESSEQLLIALNRLKSDELILENEGYISLDDNRAIAFNICLGIGLLNKKNKNYGVAISQLMTAFVMLRELGGFSDEITIGLKGSISIDEI